VVQVISYCIRTGSRPPARAASVSRCPIMGRDCPKPVRSERGLERKELRAPGARILMCKGGAYWRRHSRPWDSPRKRCESSGKATGAP
jgi:hypothetical protein